MLITAYMFCDAIEFHATLLVTDCICNHPFYLSFFKTKNQMSSHKKWDFLLLLITNQIFSFRTGWEGQRSLLDPSHRFPLLQGTPKVPMSLVRSLQRIPDLLWGLHQVECAWISSSGSWPGGILVCLIHLNWFFLIRRSYSTLRCSQMAEPSPYHEQ